MGEAFLAALPEDIAARLLRTGSRRLIRSGQPLHADGVRAAGVVMSGLVSIFQPLPDGERASFGHVHPGEVIGWSALLGGKDWLQADALCDVEICWFEWHVMSALQDDARFLMASARELMDRLQNHGHERLERRTGSLPRRLAQVLIALASYCGRDSPTLIPITHQRIADDLGTSREVVTRLLRPMVEGHLIAQAGEGRIMILDTIRLASWPNAPR